MPTDLSVGYGVCASYKSYIKRKEDGTMRLKCLFFLVFLLLLPVVSWAATVQIGSPWAASTIQTAINNAKDGDIIQLTGSGSVTWTTKITIPTTKGITLTVQNGTNGTWNSNRTARTGANFPITVTVNGSITAIEVQFGLNNSVVDISGFQFKGTTTNTYMILGDTGQGNGKGQGAFRIHDNHFLDLAASPVIWNKGDAGPLYGLIDNNTFEDLGTDNYTIAIWEFYQNPSNPYPTCWGADSWARAFTWGSETFNFVEDNLFIEANAYQRHYVEHEMGGRSVIRYNTFYPTYTGCSGGTCSPDIIDAHDDCLAETNGRGTRGGEIYNNQFLGTSSSVGRNMNLRGGQWLVYNNTVTTLGYVTGVPNLCNYRASASDCTECNYGTRCGEPPQCVTKSPSYYPVQDQIQGTYTWNNTYSGTNTAPSVDSENYVPFYVQINRDYWNATNIAGAISQGLIAGYTPYTYPHPLRTGGSPARPSPPVGLEILN